MRKNLSYRDIGIWKIRQIFHQWIIELDKSFFHQLHNSGCCKYFGQRSQLKSRLYRILMLIAEICVADGILIYYFISICHEHSAVEMITRIAGYFEEQFAQLGCRILGYK